MKKKFYLFDKEISEISKIKISINYFVRLLLIVAFFRSLYFGDWVVLFVSGISFILVLLPSLFEKRFNIDIPEEFEIILVIFIYMAIFLGEARGYYTLFWWWDVLLHTASGVVLGFVGFLILFILYKQDKINARPILIVIFSFCFALAIGTLWEIFEFLIDSIFGFNMQKSGLVDTMGDLIVDAIGALFASVIGYFYLRKEEGFFIGRIIRKFIRDNPQIFN